MERDTAKGAGTARAAEIAIAILSLHVCLLAIFRRYGPFSEPTLPLVLIFSLVAFRAWTNARALHETEASRLSRLAPGRWLERIGLPGLILTAILLVLLFVFHHYGGRLGNDGVMNYIYVRSLVLDGDLDLTNEFEDFVPEKFQFYADAARATGHSPDPINEPGPALVWAPGFVLTHGLVKASGWFGSDIAANGYTYPYINTVSLMGFLFGFIAVVFSYLVARRYVDARLAAGAVSVCWLSSTLLWYTIYEPTMPHATSAASVSLFLWLWLRVRDRPSKLGFVFLGLAAGLILSMQRYNVFFLAGPALTIVGSLLTRPRWRSRRTFVTAALVAGAVLVTASPMLIYNYTRTGTFFRIVDLGGFTLRHWAEPRIGEFLFSSNHGLFSWTPVAAIAMFGLVLLARKDFRVAAMLLVTLGFGLYLLSSTWDWYAGYAFGSRRTTEAFLIFAVGFCVASEFVLRRPKLLAVGGVAILVSWNFLLAGQVRRGEIPGMGTFAFSEAASRAATRYYRRFGHPASVPANWWFARKYGLSPDRFDAIYGHREYHNLRIDVGSAQDQYFLGRGWSLAERTGDRSWRWSSGASSTFLVPLFGAYDYRVSLTGEPSRHPEGAAQVAVVRVNGLEAARLRLVEGWQTAEAVVPASFWKSRLNEIRFDWLWTIEADEAYGGNDPREIAFKLDVLDLQIVK